MAISGTGGREETRAEGVHVMSWHVVVRGIHETRFP